MTRTPNFNRRTFLKTFGAAALAGPFLARAVVAAAQSRGVLRHASFGANGMAWEDIQELAKNKQLELVAVAEVDLARTLEVRKAFPRARIYQDYRKLLDKEARNIDSVNVSTPDHMHAPIAMSAMELGKHVYGQKPLAHDLFEVRRMTEFARRKKLITQMGIQIQSTAMYRLGVLLVQAGAVGKIKEVHSWCPKSWGDAGAKPNRRDPVPAGFNWDLWLGVCENRPFIGNAYYHPANWRKRLDFGTGTFGDMDCHILDPVFGALGLRSPISVRSEGAAPNAWNWALDSRIEYIFPGNRRTADSTVKVTWYDGSQAPPAEVLKNLEGDDRPAIGSIFIGTEGSLVLPHISQPILYPGKKFASFKMPEVESGDHWTQFVQACLGKDRTTANFDFAGPLTEAVLLGGVASRFPKTTLQWDGANLQFDLAEANRFVRRAYRPGWKMETLL